MEGRKCNTLFFAELLFLSFPSRHFHFEHPKRAFSLNGEVNKEKKSTARGNWYFRRNRTICTHKLYIREAKARLQPI